MSIVCIVSGKGGSGASCVTAYLGSAMADTQRKILLIELGPKSLDIITSTLDNGAFDLGDILDGICEPSQAVVTCNMGKGLYLLPGASQYRPMPYKYVEMVTDSLSREYEHVFLDCGTTWSVFPQILEKADRVLAVTSPGLLGARAVGRMTQLLSDKAFENARLIINKVPVNLIPANSISDLDDVIDIAGLQLLGVIPYSRDIRQSSALGRPMDKAGQAGQIFQNIADRMNGKQVPLLIT